MSVECWKIENDLCRCCHSEGTHKNLAEPCLEGEEEVYSEMLKVTLDINIAPVSGPLSTVTYTICEACIMRLQDAWSFKQQVLQCESRFNDLYTRNVIKMEPDSIIIDVKKEADSDNEGLKEERLDDDSDDDFTMPYEDGGNKSDDSEMDVQQEVQKPKPKPKPKAKPKAKAPPKKKPARPSTAKDAAPSATSQQSEQKNKDGSAFLVCIDEYRQIKVGKNSNKFMCMVCGAIYNSVKFTKHHLLLDHLNYDDGVNTNQKGPNFCNICKKSFSFQEELLLHLRCKHAATRCQECMGKVPKKQVARHKHEVHGVAKHTCGVCGFKSLKHYQLIQHQRQVHMKERPVPCSKCDATFYDKAHLKLHMVAHDPVKQFECQYCKKKFARVRTLKLHEKIHTGEKDKMCKICKQGFVQKASLNYHMKKHHPDSV